MRLRDAKSCIPRPPSPPHITNPRPAPAARFLCPARGRPRVSHPLPVQPRSGRGRFGFWGGGRRRCGAGRRQKKCGAVRGGGLPRCPASSPQCFGDADAERARVTAARPRWQRAARWCFAPNKGPWPWLYPKTQPRRFPAGTCPGKLLSDVCLSPSPSPKPSPHRAGAFWAVVAVSPPGSPGAPNFGGCWRARLWSWPDPNTLCGAQLCLRAGSCAKGPPRALRGWAGRVWHKTPTIYKPRASRTRSKPSHGRVPAWLVPAGLLAADLRCQ